MHFSDIFGQFTQLFETFFLGAEAALRLGSAPKGALLKPGFQVRLACGFIGIINHFTYFCEMIFPLARAADLRDRPI